MNKTWWKESVVYQIYPRSFNDGNGDGVGDLPGILNKLDYLEFLGIDIVWLCPVYQSPNDDNGYDISDYRSIAREYGSMEDFERLLDGLHERGIKLIMDLVVNHTSDEHFWFQEARKSKNNQYRDYYIWESGKDGGPPNNWLSFFGGTAWEHDKESDEYYLHLFSRKQPDLNWENARLRQEIYDMMHFWLQKGVDGFRMDVIPLISKRPGFPDIDPANFLKSVNQVYANGPRVHEFLQEMNEEVLSRYDIMTVGEAIGVEPEQGNLYVGEDRNELNMIFHFGHMFLDSKATGRFDSRSWDLNEFKNVFSEWDQATGETGWVSIFLGNHDFARVVSRFGDANDFRTESAKLFLTLILTMRGTPYIFQGDEIGMKNLTFSEIDEVRDLESIFYYHEMTRQGADPQNILKAISLKGRDNARSPMQWDDTRHSGFSKTKPWLRINEDFSEINVKKAMEDPGSVLHYTRSMIRLRKQNLSLVYGDYHPVDAGNLDLFIFDRILGDQHIRVELNFSGTDQELPGEMKKGKHLMLSNYPDRKKIDQVLRPWESRISQL